MRQQSHNKHADVTQSLVEKACLYCEAVFDFSGGIEILSFCSIGRIHEHKFTPVLFQE